VKEQALSHYQALMVDRQKFLDSARECSKLTLPYLIPEDGHTAGGQLNVPWQSVGAKGVNVLSSKLMLSLFPVNTSFFKLQINDAELMALPELTPEVRSEVDLTLSKLERMVMQQIAETSDRVKLHTAMKHLVVSGNVLIFAGKKTLKVYPLDRYVLNRDGDGNIIEIITVDSVHRSLLPKQFQKPLLPAGDVNAPGEDGPHLGAGAASHGGGDEADVYTWARFADGQWKWHQEVDGAILPGSQSSSPMSINPWIPLRFNSVEGTGEDYGRGRVEEFLGDLKSLEGLMQSLVEGSAAAAKVIFLVSPSATTKPQALARAQNGAIIQGRPDDVGVIQVGKTADFRTVMEMINSLTERLSDAFLILNPRHSERTTATEIAAVQQELNEQLGGIYGNLTNELLQPYLHRKLYLLQRNKSVPTLPKGLVMPTVVAGLNGIGRGQDKLALMEFVTTVAQGMGPEALAQYINPTEFLKRLAAASGIDTLNLIKDAATMEAEAQQAQEQATGQALISQMGQLAKSPIGEKLINDQQQQQQPQGGEATPPLPGPPV
jgi:hypothetical protein